MSPDDWADTDSTVLLKCENDNPRYDQRVREVRVRSVDKDGWYGRPTANPACPELFYPRVRVEGSDAMTDAWSDADWQDRAAAGRDLGGRHLGERPARHHTYECMNCGVTRTTDPAVWESCEDELGRSCRRREMAP